MSAFPIDNTIDVPGRRAPLVLNHNTFGAVTNTICRVNEDPAPPKAWTIAFVISAFWMAVFGGLVGYLIATGVGVWGNQNPVMWAFDITNFVFWVGIGHAGTLISAILFLFRQKWRTAINRFAEAMTIFAVICAGSFPGIHIGRVWVAYWLFPIPNQMDMWPQFRSPLLWDVFAVGTYFTVSLLFWYLGMVPDLATLRDRANNKIKAIAYGLFSLGWRGSNRHWHRYERAYLLLAALSTPLVLSVHSVVSFDFAMAITPGWHTTIFPPYFVAGAIFSGIGMVFTIIIPIRKYFRLQHIVTINHLDAAAKLALFTSMVVGCAYIIEFWVAWYSANEFEQAYFWNRVFGQWWWAAWIMLTCNMIFPLSLFSQRLRRNPSWLFILSILINLGMWFERFVIIVPSLSHEFEPWQWSGYIPSWVDISILAGSFGWFFMWFLLFIKNLPVIAIAEVKEIVPPRLRTHAAIADIDVTGHHVDYSPETPGERE